MTRRSTLGWGAALLAATMMLGALLNTVPGSTAVDHWWHDAITNISSPELVAFARGMDWLGGGAVANYIIPLLIGLLLLLMRGWRSAVFALIAFATSALLVQAFKQMFGRDRPEGLMVAVDYGSYPSGHTANAATIAIVLRVIFPRLLIAILGTTWVLLMALSRTALSVHWITDTLGGTMLGIGAGLLVAGTMITGSLVRDTGPDGLSRRDLFPGRR